MGVVNDSLTGLYFNLYAEVSLVRDSGRNSILDDGMILGLKEEVILISSFLSLTN